MVIKKSFRGQSWGINFHKALTVKSKWTFRGNELFWRTDLSTDASLRILPTLLTLSIEHKALVMIYIPLKFCEPRFKINIKKLQG